MKTNLQDQLENDITTLIDLLTSNQSLPPLKVMATVPVILRKWFQEEHLNTLVKELEVKLEFPVLDTKPVFSELEKNSIKFFAAGGILIGNYSIEGTHISTDESNATSSILSKMDSVFLTPDEFYQSERIFFAGKSFTVKQIILFAAHKFADVRYDEDEKWQSELEVVSDYCVFGNPNQETEIKRVELTDEPNGKLMITVPSSEGNLWGCFEIELLALAQAFVNIHCEGERILMLD